MGSEMCIRDRLITTYLPLAFAAEPAAEPTEAAASNAAIEAASVDSAAQFRSNLFELVDSVPLVGSMLSVIWFSVTDFKGWEGFVPILVKTLIILGSGWLGFLLLRPAHCAENSMSAQPVTMTLAVLPYIV